MLYKLYSSSYKDDLLVLEKTILDISTNNVEGWRFKTMFLNECTKRKKMVIQHLNICAVKHARINSGFYL